MPDWKKQGLVARHGIRKSATYLLGYMDREGR